MRDTKNWGKMYKKNHRSPNVCTGHPARNPHPDSIIASFEISQPMSLQNIHPALLNPRALAETPMPTRTLGRLFDSRFTQFQLPKSSLYPEALSSSSHLHQHITRVQRQMLTLRTCWTLRNFQIGTSTNRLESDILSLNKNQQKIHPESRSLFAHGPWSGLCFG